MCHHVRLALVCIPLLVLAACGSIPAGNASSTSTAAGEPTAPTTQATGFTVYTSPDHKYHISYPTGWQVNVANGNPGKVDFSGPNQDFQVSDDASTTPLSAIATSRLTWPGAAPMAPRFTAMTNCMRFIPSSSSRAPAEPPPATRSCAPSPCPRMSSWRTLPATPLIPTTSPSRSAPPPRARSQKWRSTSWCAARAPGGSLPARTRRSDQVEPSDPRTPEWRPGRGTLVQPAAGAQAGNDEPDADGHASPGALLICNS